MKNIKGKLIITLIGVIINLSLLSNISNAQNSGPGQAPANASGFRTPNS